MATLPLRQAPGSRIYRKVVEILRADAELRKANPYWSVGTQRPPTAATFSSPAAVGIRLRPEIGPDSWYSPDAFLMPLVIHTFIEVEGYDEDDLMNIWDAIVHALYPIDDPARRLAIQAELRALGAETGQPLFRAAYDDDPSAGDDGRFKARGEIRINIVYSVDP